MLTDFFRVNSPYGFDRNNKGGWMAFNREYMPIGFNSAEEKELNCKIEKLPVYSLFPKLTEALILELTEYDERAITRDKHGNICRFWLYGNATDPMKQQSKFNEYWETYWRKLETLSRLDISK